MDLFEKKRKQIEKDFQQQHEDLYHSERRQLATLQDIKILFQRFRHQLSEWRIKSLLEGDACLLCHKYTQLKDFTKGHCINSSLYCDQHGDLMLSHRPIHKDSVVGCKECAILDCWFRNPNHQVGNHEDCTHLPCYQIPQWYRDNLTEMAESNTID